MTERITCVSLNDDPNAIEWLMRPTPCIVCGGSGEQSCPGHWADGALLIHMIECTSCQGTGFAAWFSWN